MSGYYNEYEDQPRRQKSHRSRRPVYEEEIIEQRTTRPARQMPMDLVRRRDDSSDSVEEVARDFPPGGGYQRRSKTYHDSYPPPRARSIGRKTHSYNDYYYEDSRRSDGDVRSRRGPGRG